ncbi:MAG: TetR/AcrR family transcriptional regulator [Myxococcota bacterium]
MSYAKTPSTRDAALRATAHLLRTRGYAATGLRDIVEASGVPKGSLYHHFSGGKSQIAAAALHATGVRMKAGLEAMAEAHQGDPVAAVREFCDRYVEQLETSGFELGCPLATVSLESTPDEVRTACGAAFRSIVSVLETRLLAGGLEPATAEHAAEFAVAAIEGGLVLSKAQTDTQPLSRVRDHICTYLETLLKDAERSND